MYTMLILVLLVASMVLQFYLRSVYARWSEVRGSRPETGAQLARMSLDRAGLRDVAVEATPGVMSDHYDPRAKRVFLSEGVFGSSSVAAQAIAAHECGHALQDAEAMAMLRLRGFLATPLAASGWLAPMMVMAGLALNMAGLFWLGAAIFALILVFHLVTLPVEFDASRRALVMMREQGFMDDQTAQGSRHVLSVAAMTYIAAAAMAFVQLMQILTARRS